MVKKNGQQRFLSEDEKTLTFDSIDSFLLEALIIYTSNFRPFRSVRVYRPPERPRMLSVWDGIALKSESGAKIRDGFVLAGIVVFLYNHSTGWEIHTRIQIRKEIGSL